MGVALQKRCQDFLQLSPCCLTKTTSTMAEFQSSYGESGGSLELVFLDPAIVATCQFLKLILLLTKTEEL